MSVSGCSPPCAAWTFFRCFEPLFLDELLRPPFLATVRFCLVMCQPALTRNHTGRNGLLTVASLLASPHHEGEARQGHGAEQLLARLLDGECADLASLRVDTGVAHETSQL